MHRSRVGWISLAAVVSVGVLTAALPKSASAQSAAQAKCVVDMNKSARKVAKVTGSSAIRCFKDAVSGSLTQPSVDACVTLTTPKEAAAQSKTALVDSSRCGSLPSFGYVGAVVLNAATENGVNALVNDVFGPDLNAAVLAGSSQCQQRVQKAYGKLLDTKLKVFEKCKKVGFKKGQITSDAQLASCADLIAYGCGGPALTVPPPWASCKDHARVQAAVVKLADAVARYCPAVNMNVVFPGGCVNAPDFVACLDKKIECTTCQMLNQNDGLLIDCDTFDDGIGNQSCAYLPNVSTTTTVPTTLGTTTTTSTTTTVVAAVCGNSSIEGAEQCDDGNTSAGDCCSPTCQYDGAGTPCTSDANGCTDDVCNGTGSCQHTNNTDPCNDGLFCNGADSCSGGSCTGHAGNPCPGADGDFDCSESCDETADSCTAIDPVGFGCDDGSCLPCGDGQRCISPLGCDSGVCTGGSLTMPPPWATCQPASCSDGVQNGGETDIDCGGATTCPRCQAGDSCFSGSDCGSSVCSSGLCQAPTCGDGVQNGNESDVDCGGSCPDCLPGETCNAGADCTSGICSGGLCTTPTCSDGVKNQGEGDVDCGGPCADCALGKTCNAGGDCQTGSCNGGICRCPSHLFTFNISSNSGGVFDSAEWPGGNASQSVPGGCGVTIKRPGDNIDLVCSLGGGGFAVIGVSGFSSCFGTGGEDGDGCQADSCPPAGVPSCCATRPSCSAALNGSGTARYFVQCNP